MKNKDIEDTEDVQRLVDHFYMQVVRDELLGPVFNDLAKVDWEAHLPKMYSFWTSVLFGKASFKGNPMAIHLVLSEKTEMGGAQFERWLKLWKATVDKLFVGELAEDAKRRAESIAGLMLYKIRQASGNLPEGKL